MNKKILLLSIALAIVAFGAYYSYNNFKKPVKVVEIKDSPLSILTQNVSETFTEGSDWYDTKIQYPKNSQKVSDLIFANYNEYLKDTGVKNYASLAEAKEGLQINVDGLQYAYSAEYSLATSTNSVSYIYQIYTFTGGAHGSTIVYPITLNENQEIVTAEQVLPSDKLTKVSKLAYADLLKQKRERMKSYGSMTESEITDAIKDDTFLLDGTKPTRENYSVVWPEGDDLVISFGQYQVGPYAEGIYEVRIPKSSI